jgi:signal transduction histidine kinase
MILFFLGAFGAVLLLDKQDLSVFSKMLFMCVTSGLLAFYSLVLSKDSGAYIVIISIVHVPIILFERTEEKKAIFFATLIPIATAYFLVFVDYQLFFLQAELSEIAERVIHACAISTAFLFSVLSVYIFYRSNEKFISEIESSHISLQTAYEDLQLQQNLLEKSWHDSVYAQLTRTIAHELKNPLFEFGMVIGALEKSLDDRETAMMFISSLATTIEELMALVNAMLESGGASVGEYKEMRIAEVMNRVLILAEGSIKKRNIQLTKEIADVPSVMGDSKAFLMVFSNLIVNAMEAMDDGVSAVLTVRVMADPSPQSGRQGVVVEISDTGVGIPKSRQAGLFKGGQSTKGIAERQRGIGLGLVWKLIDQMGGEITVHSDPDVAPGTMFRIVV